MAGALDSFLNVAVPTLLILVVIGFLWTRTPLGPWLGPHLHNFWLWIKGEGEQQQQHQQQNRVIVYE